MYFSESLCVINDTCQVLKTEAKKKPHTSEFYRLNENMVC